MGTQSRASPKTPSRVQTSASDESEALAGMMPNAAGPWKSNLGYCNCHWAVCHRGVFNTSAVPPPCVQSTLCVHVDVVPTHQPFCLVCAGADDLSPVSSPLRILGCTQFGNALLPTSGARPWVKGMAKISAHGTSRLVSLLGMVPVDKEIYIHDDCDRGVPTCMILLNNH